MALWRIRATVDDRPGFLSVLTASLALSSVNILAVQVHTTESGAVDDFLVDAPDTMDEAALLAAITKGRGRDAFVVRAEARGLADQPTRALALADRLAHDPDALGEALVSLLDATEVRWRPDAPAVPAGCEPARMTLADPAGGSFEVLRARPAFTPAEFARAQALVELAGTVQWERADQVTLLLPDGTELLIRGATEEDLARTDLDSGLVRLDPYARGRVLLALADGRIVAVARLVAEGDLGEVTVRVADDRRRCGIGTALLRRLHAHAVRCGLAALVAHGATGDEAALRTMRRLGTCTIDSDDTRTRITLPVPAADRTPATFG